MIIRQMANSQVNFPITFYSRPLNGSSTRLFKEVDFDRDSDVQCTCVSRIGTGIPRQTPLVPCSVSMLISFRNSVQSLLAETLITQAEGLVQGRHSSIAESYWGHQYITRIWYIFAQYL